MMLMEYHIVFIIISFIMLFYVFELLFREDNPRSTIAAMIMCGINTTICVINYLSFFGIGIVGYLSDGTVEVNTFGEMYPLFVFFFGMYWINIILIFYCWYKFTFKVWTKSDKL